MSESNRQNLYLKYRPSRFSELAGQEHITKTIQNAVSSNRLAHAYMFSGPRGTGKTSAARLLAKLINCTEPVKDSSGFDCCGQCSNCKRIAEMSFIDMVEIDAASNNSVEDVRQMREKLKYRPIEGKYKIYIIDEVHMLSGSAFNAFLKTLEEPPLNVVFILATTDPQKVPATIISRCQCFDFRPVASKIIQQRLELIVKKESQQADFPEFEPMALAEIARAAQGGFRDALSLLEQIAVSTPEKHVSIDMVLSMTRRLGYAALKELSDFILQGDTAKLLFILSELYSKGYEPLTIGRDLLEYFRRCMILKIAPDAAVLIDIPTEMTSEIDVQIKELPKQKLVTIVHVLENAVSVLRTRFNPAVFLEIELVKITMDKDLFDNIRLHERLEKLEKQAASAKPIAYSVPRKTLPTQTVREPAVFYETDSDPLQKFKNAVASRSNICQALLVNSIIKTPENGILSVEVTQKFAFDKLNEEKNKNILLKSAQDVFKDAQSVRILSPDSRKANDDKKPPARSHDEEIKRLDKKARDKILKKPEIAEAIEVFGGEIVSLE